jgi:hypothetical protein
MIGEKSPFHQLLAAKVPVPSRWRNRLISSIG